MDRLVDSSLPFDLNASSSLPQLRHDLSASLLSPPAFDAGVSQDDSITAVVAAASGVPHNLDSIGNLSPHRTRSIRDHESQIADLKKENFSLKLRIYFLEERFKTVQESDEEDGAFQLNIDLQVEVAQLKNENRDKQGLLQRAATAIDMLTSRNEELQQEEQGAGELRSQLSSVREELQQSQQESKHYHDEYQNTRTELQTMQGIQGDHIALRKRFDDLLQRTTAEKEKLEQQLQAADRNLQEAGSSLASMERANEEVSEAHATSSSLAGRVPQLQSTLEHNAASIKKLQDDLQAATEQCGRLEQEKDGIQAAGSKKALELQLELRTRDAQISDLNAEIAHHQELLKGVEANLKESHGTSVQRAVHHYEELMSQQARDLSGVRDRLQAVQKLLTQKEAQLAALESQVAERDGQLVLSATEVDSKADALRQATASAQKNAELVKDLGGQLKAKSNEIAQLQQELADAKDRLDDLAEDSEQQADKDAAERSSRIRSLSREVEKLRALLEQERQSKGLLQDNLQALKDALSSKEQALQNVRRQVEHSTQLHGQRQARLEQQYQDQLETLRRELSRRDATASRLSSALQEKEEAIKDLSDIASRLGGEGSSSEHRDLHVRQLTGQVLDLRRKIEHLLKEKDTQAEDFEKQLQQLRRQNSKLQRELKDAQGDLKQSRHVAKRIEEANESRENLLDALNRSFLSDAGGDETANELLHSELAARDAEILALTSQLHEKDKQLQALSADYDRIQKSHAQLVQQMQASLHQKDATIEQLLKAGREKDEQLLQLTEQSMTRSGQGALAHSQLGELREANAKLESMARSRETQLQSFQVAAQAKDGVIKSLQEQLQMQRGRASMSPSRRSAEGLEADLLTTHAQLKASQEMVDAMRKQLSDVTRQRDNAQRQLAAITDEALSLAVDDTDNSSRPGASSRSQVDEGEIGRLRAQLAETGSMVGSLRGQLTDAQRWNETLQSRLDKEKAAVGQVSELTAKLHAAESDLARSRRSADVQHDQLKQRDMLLEDTTRLQAQLRAANSERELVQLQLDSLRKATAGKPQLSPSKHLEQQRELARLHEANRKLQEELTRAGDDVRIAGAEKQSLQGTLQKVRNDLNSRQEHVRRLEAEVERLRAELLTVQSERIRSTAADEDVSRLRRELQDTTAKLEASESDLRHAQSEIGGLQSRLVTSQAEEKRLAAENGKLRADVAEHLHTVASLRQDTARLRGDLSTAEHENEKLHAQLQATLTELRQAQDLVRQLRAELAKRPSAAVDTLPVLQPIPSLSDNDLSDVNSQADSIPDLSVRYAEETARLRQELEVTRALVDRLSAERNAMDARCKDLSRQLAAEQEKSRVALSLGRDSATTAADGVQLNDDLIQQLLRMQRAEEELQRELRRLLLKAGYSPADVARLVPEHQVKVNLDGLRQRYADGVRANDQLRSRLQDQLSACETDRHSWQQRKQELQEMQVDVTAGKSSGGHLLDLGQSSGLSVEDLHGLCHDLGQSLRASQALQADLGHSLSANATPMTTYLQHEKERLVQSVSDLQERLGKLEAENRSLRSRFAASTTSSSTSPAHLTELERELHLSHAIATRLHDTLHSREQPAQANSQHRHRHDSSSEGQEALVSQLMSLRQALQQHSNASESLRDQIAQPAPHGAAASSPAHSQGVPTSTGPGHSQSAGFSHMERQVRDGLQSLARLESAIASAPENVDKSTVDHLLQLARQLRAQLEAAETLLAQLKHIAPTSVSAVVENQLIKTELAQLRAKLASHEKIMRKALKHIQKSKESKDQDTGLLAHLQQASGNVRSSKQGLETFVSRHQP